MISNNLVANKMNLDKFEADGSMARIDFNLSPSGDAYDVNGTLFGQLINDCQSADYSHDCMGKFNQQRFNQSLTTNGYMLSTLFLPLPTNIWPAISSTGPSPSSSSAHASSL